MSQSEIFVERITDENHRKYVTALCCGKPGSQHTNRYALLEIAKCEVAHASGHDTHNNDDNDDDDNDETMCMW